MVLRKALSVALSLGLFATTPALAQAECTIRQITDFTQSFVSSPSLDRGSIAFVSNADLRGGNPDRSDEIFLFEGGEITQITSASGGFSAAPSLDDGMIAFHSSSDLTGQNADGNNEIFLFDGSSTSQVTSTTGSSTSFFPSLDDGSIAFVSDANLAGGPQENPDFSQEIFLFDGTTISQVTDGTRLSREPSLEGGSIAFHSTSDLTGENPDGNDEIFLFNGSTLHQITNTTVPPTSSVGSKWASLDGGSIAFLSNADLTGGNPDNSYSIFTFDGSTLTQIARGVGGGTMPRLDGGLIAFVSAADLTGENPDQNQEVFFFDGAAITQVTKSIGGQARFNLSIDDATIAFTTSADLVGHNPDNSPQVFLASCVPNPPGGEFLTSPEIPDFRFKVRITAGDQAIAGRQEADCLGETLCVSAALPGRSELFLRIIGPRPNGFLWTNLVRFTPSRVEVWAEQISSGTVNYYDLSALPREDTELTGLVDKQAFPPRGSGSGGLAGAAQPVLRARELTLWEAGRPRHLAPSGTGLPGPLTFTSPAFPDFRFTVRIFSGTEEQPAQVESACIPETICVSGALPGRSELFLRIIGPRPNGFLWTNLVRFTTSRVEVEIEQLSTGDRNTYVLDPVPRESDELPGRVDKEAFSPQ